MSVYEIGNPSDPYTMKSENVVAAAVACMLLGEGAYNLQDRDGKQVCPFFMFGVGDPNQWLRDTHGISLDDAMSEHRAAIADALESVLVGGFAERDDVESATAKMSAEDARAWLAERHDRHRSSMNNIGRRAASLAKRLREQPAASAV